MRLVAGQLEPTAGTVTVVGVGVHRASDAHRARAALAFVPDSPLLYDDLSVTEHLELVGLAHGVGDGLDERIADLLDALDLTARRDFVRTQLSRGMRQKTQLACTLVRPFEVLLLDEPVVGLDPPSQGMLRELLGEIKADGAAVVLTTHQLALSEGLVDRAVVLHDGSVVDAGDYGRVSAGGCRPPRCRPHTAWVSWAAPPTCSAGSRPGRCWPSSPTSAPAARQRRAGQGQAGPGHSPGMAAAGRPPGGRASLLSGRRTEEACTRSSWRSRVGAGRWST
jgi:ABC-2 type transport system ATP-binding protein